MFRQSKIFAALAFVFTLIFAVTAMADYQRYADNTVPAYRDEGLTNRTGNERVDRGDLVTVHQETGRAYEVTYPTPSGSKRRWVSKDIFNVNYTQPEEGDYYLIPENSPSHAIDVPNNSHDAGTILHMYSKNGSAAQIFTLRRVNNEWYKIIHKDSGYVINCYGGYYDNGNRLILWHDDGTASCYWRFKDLGNGVYNIESQLPTNPYLEVQNGNSFNGAVLQLWQQHSFPAARWKLEKIGGSNEIPAKLQELINRWDGRKWTDGYSRSGNSEKYLNSSAIQCKEFASYIFNILYDTGYIGSGSTSSNYYNWRLNNTPARVYQVAEVPQTNNASQAREAFKNLFTQAQPGDFIQIKRGSGGAHSAIFVRRTDNGIQWLDANADGANSIKLQNYSYDYLVRTTNKGYQWNVAMSLYRAR